MQTFEVISSATLQVVTIVKDCFLACLAAGTLWVGIRGLQTWRRQLVGSVHFDAARKHARAAFKLRDDLRAARSPVFMSNEFPATRDRENADAEGAAMWDAFAARMNPVWESLREFDLSALESEALWGSAIKVSSDRLRNMVARLQAAQMAYCANIRSNGQDFQSNPEWGVGVRRQTVGSGGEDDDFSQEILAAIDTVVAELRQHLQR